MDAFDENELIRVAEEFESEKQKQVMQLDEKNAQNITSNPFEFVSLSMSSFDKALRKLNELGHKEDYDLMMLSKTEIQNYTHLKTKLEVDEFRTIISNKICETIVSKSALQMYQNNVKYQTRLSFGCPILDQYLKRGIVPGNVTEISGVAGSGKTQFCLQLCLQTQLPVEMGGLNGFAIYISTEQSDSALKRLNQMAEHFSKKHK